MKRCSTCQRTYTDDSQKFCPNDGTPLVSEEPAPFDPEATVMSLSSQMEEEPPPPPMPPAQPPNQYYNPGAGPNAQPEQSVHQSYPPPPTPGAAQGGGPSPAWPPQPPQQQPYYPQPGAQPAAPQWQGAGQPPPWMPPGQSPQGQNWGAGGGVGAGGYYPQQPGQYAPQAAGGQALGLVALIVGAISFIAFSLVFGMFMRIVPGDRSVAELSIYTTLLAGILAAIVGLIALVTSQRRSKTLGIIGLLISIPGILFFIYIASRYGLR
jgi:hypothetical protein